MPRYVVGRKRASEDWFERTMQPLGHPTVYDHEPIKTGIVDASGNPIYRLPDPIGFLPVRMTDERAGV